MKIGLADFYALLISLFVVTHFRKYVCQLHVPEICFLQIEHYLNLDDRRFVSDGFVKIHLSPEQCDGLGTTVCNPLVVDRPDWVVVQLTRYETPLATSLTRPHTRSRIIWPLSRYHRPRKSGSNRRLVDCHTHFGDVYAVPFENARDS